MAAPPYPCGKIKQEPEVTTEALGCCAKPLPWGPHTEREFLTFFQPRGFLPCSNVYQGIRGSTVYVGGIVFLYDNY